MNQNSAIVSIAMRFLLGGGGRGNGLLAAQRCSDGFLDVDDVLGESALHTNLE